MKKEESRKIRLVLEKAFYDAVNKLKSDHPTVVLADLQVQMSPVKRTLSFCDDKIGVLKSIYLEEELPNAETLEFFYANAPRFFKEVAVNCRNRKLFNEIEVMTPFSLIVTDDEGNTILNYLLLNGDRIVTEEKLMKDLDKDLDLFLKNLLADLE